MKRNLFLLAALLIMMVAQAQPKKETLSNKSVLSMCKAGLSAETVLAKIQSSECKFDVSTDALIALKTGKVPDEVIEAMVKKSEGGEAPASTTQTKPTSLKTAKTDTKTAQPETKPAKPEAATPPKKVDASTAASPDLDFINVPHFYDRPRNDLKPLERSTVAVKAKLTLKAMVPGSTTPIVFKMDSASSPVRISEQESLSFLVNTGTALPEIFGLYRMKPLKNKREATWFNVTAFENKSHEDVFAFNYRKIKEGVYEIVPLNKLTKGEYCFVNKASYTAYNGARADVFAFGVD